MGKNTTACGRSLFTKKAKEKSPAIFNANLLAV